MSVNNIFDICSEYNEYPSVIEPVKRIVAIGDIHGDFEYLIHLLKIASVIDNENHWIGGDTHIVQLGDQIDNCRTYYQDCGEKDATPNDHAHDIKIIEYLDQLDEEAKKTGGRVISLIGNHELMNIKGDLKNVSYENMSSVGGVEQRAQLFSKNGKIGKKIICTHPPAIIIGSNLFAHAGMTPQLIDELPEIRKLLNETITFNIEQMESKKIINLFISCTISKKIGSEQIEFIDPPNAQFWNKLFKNLNDPKSIISQISDNDHVLLGLMNKTNDMKKYLIKHQNIFGIDNMNPIEVINTTVRLWLFKKINRKYLSSTEVIKSLFWNRILGSIPNEKHKNVDFGTCDGYVKPVLKFLNINHMIVGHTPQYIYNQSGINSSCNGAVYKTDIGGGDSFDKFDTELEKTGKISKNRVPQVLVIDNDDTFRVLYDEKYNTRMHGGKIYNFFKNFFFSV